MYTFVFHQCELQYDTYEHTKYKLE